MFLCAKDRFDRIEECFVVKIEFISFESFLALRHEKGDIEIAISPICPLTSFARHLDGHFIVDTSWYADFFLFFCEDSFLAMTGYALVLYELSGAMTSRTDDSLFDDSEECLGSLFYMPRTSTGRTFFWF